MADETQTQTTPPVLPNDPAARTADGTLKDQSVTTPAQTDSSTTQAKDGTDQNQTQQTKSPTEGKSAATDTGAAPQGAPEAYADFKVPDGFALDKAAIDKVLPVFKELNLNQDQAQKLVDQYATITREAAEAPVKAYAEMQKEWTKDANERFGKDIAPGGKIVTQLAQTIDGFLPPSLAKSFRAALDFTGAGNHPDLIEGLYTLSKALAVGTHVNGKGPSPEGQKAPGEAPKSIAQAMYPNLPSASR